MLFELLDRYMWQLYEKKFQTRTIRIKRTNLELEDIVK